VGIALVPAPAGPAIGGARVIGPASLLVRAPGLSYPRPGVGARSPAAGSGVGLTVADLAPLPPGSGPPVTSVPPLGEVLPRSARTAAEQAAELQRVDRMEAELAAHELELVAGFAADRPASADRQPGEPGAATSADTAPQGVSEFFPDEFARTLNCARATATRLAEHALTRTRSLPATLAELAAGRPDWARARTVAEEPGWSVRGTDPPPF
jgi:hypothetical protein